MDNNRPIEEWSWEGNIQNTLIPYLVRQGWELRGAANTISHQHGPDIEVAKGTKRLLVEVKGYPSKCYVRGEKAGQPKPTQPSLQASHWFSEAMSTTIRRRCNNKEDEIAMAFPYFKRYRNLVKEVEWALRKLNIGVYFIREDGSVEEAISISA